MRRRRVLVVTAAVTIAVVAIFLLATAAARGTPPAGNFEPNPVNDEWPVPSGGEHTVRAAAMRAADVRIAGPGTNASPDFSANPPDPTGLLSRDPVTCRFVPRNLAGTTPKFDCVLEGGEVVRVKYGRSPERHAEIAATRLLAVAGFGADRVYQIPRLRCYGCPRQPFSTMKALTMMGLRQLFLRAIGDDAYTDFEWVTVERRFEGKSIEEGDLEGWAWFELKDIDPSVGASRADVDALRLMALFLTHWDNKADNQRLVCLPGAEPRPDGSCPQPFALIDDVGGTFGPRKVDFNGWKAVPIWADARTCIGTMRDLPHRGGTFVDVQITEGGRRRFLETVGRLTVADVTALFEAARFPAYRPVGEDARTAAEWTAVFRERVRRIAEAGPCPSTVSPHTS
jgi:hypothetical protein